MQLNELSKTQPYLFFEQQIKPDLKGTPFADSRAAPGYEKKHLVECALLEMRRSVAMIEHYNACAAKDEGRGGWQCDWSAAVREANQNFQAAKTIAADAQQL